MASSKTEGSAPKTIHHTVTVGGILMLKNALGGRSWYKEQPIEVLLAAVDVQQGPMASLKDPKPAEDESQADYDERVEPILVKACSLDLTEQQRVACRECVRFFLKQGAWPANIHTATLIRELELT